MQFSTIKNAGRIRQIENGVYVSCIQGNESEYINSRDNCQESPILTTVFPPNDFIKYFRMEQWFHLEKYHVPYIQEKKII